MSIGDYRCMNLSRVANTILNFFFTDVCVVCGKKTGEDNSFVCHGCIDKIEYIKPLYCQSCSQPLHDGGAHCWQCRKSKYHFERIVAVGKYKDILRKLVLKFKEKDFLKVVLGDLLSEVIVKNFEIANIDMFVPVPLSKKRELKRGYNQSHLLADFVSKKLKKVIVPKNLVRIKIIL